MIFIPAVTRADTAAILLPDIKGDPFLLVYIEELLESFYLLYYGLQTSPLSIQILKYIFQIVNIGQCPSKYRIPMTELNTPVSNRSNVDNIVLFNIQFYYFLNHSVPDKIWVESQPEKEGRHCSGCSQSSPSQSPASGGGLVVLLPIKLREIDGNRN